jgi:integrase
MPTLTDAAIRAAKPRDKDFKLQDGAGLYLFVRPNGSKLWRLRYWLPSPDGAKRLEKVFSIGAYPAVSLAQARVKAAEARQLISQGRDPSLQKKIDRQKTQQEQATTFEAVARQWLEHQAKQVTPAHLLDCQQRLEKHVFPRMGALPLTEIEPARIATTIGAVQEGGVAHMAGRCHTMISQVFRYAISRGLTLTNPARDVRDILITKRVTHLPALTSLPELAAVLKAIDGSGAAPATKIAVRLLAMLAIRTIELRGGRWEEIDFEAATWTIPAERMKKRAVHVVPLSAQALALLRELHDLTGAGEYIFPGSGPKHPIMSEATINAAIKRAGFKGQHTGHGFRAAFSTILNEMGHRADAIEFALAHVSGDRVRAAYNRGSYFDERRSLMQEWADLLDGAEKGNVVAIGSRAA